MRKLPLARHAVRAVEGDARFTLRFDDAADSTLWLEGPFTLVSGDAVDAYEPPCAEWVRDVLAGLIGVRVADATYGRRGDLVLTFAAGRELRVEDGPFENWHYANAQGARAVGGVGRVVRWGPEAHS